jgi:Dyp-type peroxidase family
MTTDSVPSPGRGDDIGLPLGLRVGPHQARRMRMAIQTTPAPEATAIETNLDNIQGNIFGGFNKDHQAFLFVHMRHRDRGRAWLNDLIPQVATSAEVLNVKAEFRKRRAAAALGQTDAEILGDLRQTLVNVAFTWNGLRALGVSDADLAQFPDDFREGMRARGDIIGAVDESAPEHWIRPFHDPYELHAVLIVAADEAADRDARAQQLINELGRHGVSLLSRQDGNVRDEPNEHGHEHFGFDDGVSQPGVRDDRVTPPSQDPNVGLPGQDRLWPGEFVLGYPRQAAAEDGDERGAVDTQGPVFTSGPAWTGDGSYLVYFRLRQDVKGFKAFLMRQAEIEGIPTDVMGAKVVGRYPSGCPLEVTHFEPGSFDTTSGDPSKTDSSLLDPTRINDFDYHDDETDASRKGANDDDGHRVPRAAHIRKVYPRNQLPEPGESQAERRRILRRGIPYGKSFDPKAPDETFDPLHPGPNPTGANGDRGLLFLSYQGSIADKFEFLLHTWVNTSDFPRVGDGQDLILSFTTQRDVNGNQTRPFRLPGGAVPDVLAPRRWVFITGGEYFFQPSIGTLRMLAAGR